MSDIEARYEISKAMIEDQTEIIAAWEEVGRATKQLTWLYLMVLVTLAFGTSAIFYVDQVRTKAMTQEIDPAEERKELTTPEKSICEEIRDGAHAAVDCDEPDTDVEPADGEPTDHSGHWSV